MRRKRNGLAALVLTLLLIVPSAAQEVSTRAQVPDPSNLQKSTRLVREIYANEITTSRTPAQKQVLARRLITSAQATNDDPAGRYALLSLSREISTAQGDADGAIAAVVEIASYFDVDELTLRVETLKATAQNSRVAAEIRAIALLSLQAGILAVQTDRYDLADEAITLSLTQARRGTDRALVERLTTWRSDLSLVRTEYEKIKPSLAVIAQTPEDPAANLAVGRFRCFFKSEWSDGIANLARGSDKNLSAAAQSEIAAGDPGSQNAVADRWWDLGQEETSLAKRNVLAHAAAMYRDVLPSLNGLSKDKAQRRAAQAPASTAFPQILEAPAASTQPTKAAASAPSALRVIGMARVPEAQKIFDAIQAKSKDLIPGVIRVQLAGYHDGSSMKRNAGAVARLDDSYAASCIVSTTQTLVFSGAQDRLQPGNYISVYRIYTVQPLPADSGVVIEIFGNGRSIASQKLAGSDLERGKWSEVAVPFTLSEQTVTEFRLTPSGHVLALDRIYIFRLV
jgi:hypothetical protein